MKTVCDRVLAVDIGTSSVRVMVIGPGGETFAKTQIKYPTLRPAPYFEEQDPELIRRETYRAITECLYREESRPEQIAAMAFSSQMYGIFPVDADNKPLGRNILWCDGRAQAQAKRLQGGSGPGPLYQATGCPANSIYPVTKLAWFQEMLPEIAEKSSRFVSIKEFVLEPIAGQWVADHSMASGTGLFNLRECRWEKAALDFAGIEPDRLSRLIPGDEPLSFKNKELLRAWRLDDDIMVFSGGGDGPLANLGSGAAEIGAVNIDLGTSGAARVVTGQPVVDKDGCLWCYALLSGRWTMGGILTNVGNAYQWLGEQVASFQREEPLETVLERLDTYASPIDAGAEGVFFLPYLRKTRSPYWDDRLTGTIYGLRADHDLRHITRALLEAIAYDIGTIIDCMNAAVPVKDRIILTGGLSKNKLMAQIIANVLNREILVPDNSEGSIAGAALIALHGAGLIKNYHFDSPAGPSAPEGSRFLPGPADAPRYRDLYRGYTNLIHKFQMME